MGRERGNYRMQACPTSIHHRKLTPCSLVCCRFISILLKSTTEFGVFKANFDVKSTLFLNDLWAAYYFMIFMLDE